MNTVIENARRLLTQPLVLEDLARALQWLADNIARNYNIRFILDIADIDRLFPEKSTSIYRIVQRPSRIRSLRGRKRVVSVRQRYRTSLFPL
jgi:signal transduction histidine kinase